MDKESLQWLMANKAKIGTVLGAAAAFFVTLTQSGILPADIHWVKVLEIVLMNASSLLLGGGLLKSDQYHQEKLTK